MKFEIEKNWGSECIGYRNYIRNAINEQYGHLAKTNLLDLEVRPQLKSGFVSVSHTKGLGGFAYSDKPIGFDIELESRVNQAVVLRVSTPEEFLQAPSAAALWCAKEAAFKAMAATIQPKTISEFEILWKKSAPRERPSFTVKEQADLVLRNGLGQIIQHGQFLLATFEYNL